MTKTLFSLELKNLGLAQLVFLAISINAFGQSSLTELTIPEVDSLENLRTGKLIVESESSMTPFEVSGRGIFSSSPTSIHSGKGTFIDYERVLKIGRIGAFDWDVMQARPLVLQYQGGSVGIGTINPRTLLDVAGRGIFSDSPVGVYSGKGTFIDYEKTSNIGRIGAFDWDLMQTRPLVLQYQGGSVGIGTINPRTLLDVAGRGIFSDSPVGIYSGKGTFIDYEKTSNIGRIGAFDWDLMQTRPLILQYQGGNVGIGINHPARQLHISEVMRLEPQSTAPANPAKGDIYFGTDGKLHLYNGGAWFSVNMTPD